VTHTPVASRRLEFLDQLRAAAILFVLVSHFGLAIDGNFGAFENRTINFGSIGVFIFFCVSGYVIPWSMRGRNHGECVSVRNFWIRRVLRLYPMYIGAALVGMLWLGTPAVKTAIAQAYANAPLAYLTMFATMTTHWRDVPVVFDGLEWTLAYEMVFYVACTVFLVGQRVFRNTSAVIGVVVALCVLTLAPDLLHTNNDVQKFCFMYLFFAFGLLFFLKSTGFISVRLFSVLALLVVATMTARNALWYAYWGVNYMTFAFAPAVLVFYAFASGRVIVVSRAFSLIGTASYSTYLTHIYVPHALPLAALPWLWRFGVWTIVALALSVPLYFYVELPFIKAGRALPKRHALPEGSASGETSRK